MKNSSTRILTTHVGSLPRPQEVMDVMRAKESGQPPLGEERAQQLATLLRYSVGQVVRRQVEAGIDVPSDGEFAKSSFSNYVHDRLTGFEPDPDAPDEQSMRNAYRDRQRFLDFYQQYDRDIGGASVGTVVCTSPITYRGQDLVQQDIDNLKTALERFSPEEAFIPAVAPGTIELQRRNGYYATQEEFLTAIAEAMREEYRAIVDAGFILQVDDPRVVTQYGIPDPAPTIEEYRKFATLRVDALNHALEGLPQDRIRYHLCWGSWHGPHTTDVPLRDIVDIVLRVNAGAYCIEAANPRHAHEWEVWETTKLPDGKCLIPGVIAHTTNHVEHPELVAQRITNYARIIGRENVLGGSDCGFSQGAFTPRVHPSIMWAKLEALVEGAALATQKTLALTCSLRLGKPRRNDRHSGESRNPETMHKRQKPATRRTRHPRGCGDPRPGLAGNSACRNAVPSILMHSHKLPSVIAADAVIQKTVHRREPTPGRQASRCNTPSPSQREGWDGSDKPIRRYQPE